MSTYQRSRSTILRASIAVIVLSFVAAACDALPELIPVLVIDGTEATAAPEPTPKDICVALDDLSLAIDEVADTDLVAVGVNGLLEEVNVALLEGQAVASAVGEVYRPMVDDLNDSLVGLRDTLEALDRQRSLGASVVTVGVAIAEIGVAMDAIATQLQSPCPRPLL
jgi:hypothetical protein